MKLIDSFGVTDYLTQEKLYNFIKNVYTDVEIIYDKRFPNSPYTPDIYIPDMKILIEYDGNLHYDKPRSIISDNRRDEWFKLNGIDTLRIPYFVQLTTDTVKDIFDIDCNLTQIYPHGFIDKKVVLPANFSELGIHRFLKQMDRFIYIKDDIKQSLESKINLLKDERLVITKDIKKYFSL